MIDLYIITYARSCILAYTCIHARNGYGMWHCLFNHETSLYKLVSDIAVFVLKRDVKLQLTHSLYKRVYMQFTQSLSVNLREF